MPLPLRYPRCFPVPVCCLNPSLPVSVVCEYWRFTAIGVFFLLLFFLSKWKSCLVPLCPEIQAIFDFNIIVESLLICSDGDMYVLHCTE